MRKLTSLCVVSMIFGAIGFSCIYSWGGSPQDRLSWNSASGHIDIANYIGTTDNNCTYPTAVKCANGDILVSYRDATIPTGWGVSSKTVLSRSTDGGNTWSAPWVVVDFTDNNAIDGGPLIMDVLPSGRIVAWYGRLVNDSSTTMIDERQIYSDDNGSTWSDSVAIDFSPYVESSTLAHWFVLDNGAYIRPCWGWETPGGVPTGTNPTQFTMYSEDGINWSFSSVIAVDNTKVYFWSEAAMIRLPNGDIRCFIRGEGGDGGAYPVAGNNKRWSCDSSDEGITWSSPVARYTGLGHPRCTRLSNGLYISVYRGDYTTDLYLGSQFIRISADATNWGSPTDEYPLDTSLFSAPNEPGVGQWFGYYEDIIEVSPGRVLIVYSQAKYGVTTAPAPGVVRAKFLTITPAHTSTGAASFR